MHNKTDAYALGTTSCGICVETFQEHYPYSLSFLTCTRLRVRKPSAIIVILRDTTLPLFKCAFRVEQQSGDFHRESGLLSVLFRNVNMCSSWGTVEVPILKQC